MNYIASIGFFDGVHVGHLSLISQLQRQAATMGIGSMLITFTDHPRHVLEGVGPELLLTHDERLQRLQRLGVDKVVELDFTTIQSLTAEEFLHFIHRTYDVQALLMGYDHRFGSDRLIHPDDYQQAGAKADVSIFWAEQAQEGAISSTKIRRALEEGRLEEANHMLGYHYSLTGEVVHGEHIGTSLGFPTANLRVPSGILIPKSGVYAAQVRGSRALVNIGTNPTFGEDRPISVEVHIPDFDGDLYGEVLQVELHAYLREDRRFGSKSLLIGQILQDIEQLAHILR